MSSALPQPGALFEQKYRLKSVLGEGGFARIYLAVEEELRRPVALKVLRTSLQRVESRGEVTAERFRREARLVAGLRDPHTITLYDHGQTDDELLYLVFEYVDGSSLDEVLEHSDPLDPERVVTILKQTLMSLEEAHAQGVLHRDIKPGNIMLYEHLGRPDQVKLLDFGIAKAVLSEDDATRARDLTRADSIVGTPRYMAPEQFRNRDPEPASDIYSLGLVAYELLVGNRAVEADSLPNIVAEHVSGDPVQLPEEDLGAPALRRIVDRMLEPDLEDRYSRAAEVLEDLEELEERGIGRGERGAGRAPGARVEEAEAPTRKIPSSVEVQQSASGASKRAAVAGESGDRTPTDVGEAPTDRSTARSTVVKVAAVSVGVAAAAFFSTYLADRYGLLAEFVDAGPGRASGAEEMEIQRIEIDTIPTGALLEIDGAYVGESPVGVSPSNFEFPAIVEAKTGDGRSARTELEGPRSELTLRLSGRDGGTTRDRRDTGSSTEGGTPDDEPNDVEDETSHEPARVGADDEPNPESDEEREAVVGPGSDSAATGNQDSAGSRAGEDPPSGTGGARETSGRDRETEPSGGDEKSRETSASEDDSGAGGDSQFIDLTETEEEEDG